MYSDQALHCTYLNDLTLPFHSKMKFHSNSALGGAITHTFVKLFMTIELFCCLS